MQGSGRQMSAKMQEMGRERLFAGCSVVDRLERGRLALMEMSFRAARLRQPGSRQRWADCSDGYLAIDLDKAAGKNSDDMKTHRLLSRRRCVQVLSPSSCPLAVIDVVSSAELTSMGSV